MMPVVSDHPLIEVIRSSDEPHFVRRGSYDFVLRHGRGYTPAKLPSGMRRRKVGNCYGNCANFVLDARNRNSELRYVEGFAMRPSIGMLIAHSWLARDGNAHDITWRDFSGGENLDCLYFGVEFSVVTVGVIISRRGYYGLLDPVDDLVRSAFSGLEMKEAA